MIGKVKIVFIYPVVFGAFYDTSSVIIYIHYHRYLSRNPSLVGMTSATSNPQLSSGEPLRFSYLRSSYWDLSDDDSDGKNEAYKNTNFYFALKIS